MLSELIARINWLSRNIGAGCGAVQTAEAALQASFPEHYRDFLMQMDGGNGRTSLGENICFFSSRELPEINAEACAAEFVPGWLIFASDLGGRSYLMRRDGDSESIMRCFDEELGEHALMEEAKNLPDFLRKLGTPQRLPRG